MLRFCLPFVACLAPQESWVTLPLPSLCQETSPAIHFLALATADHIHLDPERSDARRGTRAILTAPDLGSLLSTVAAAAGMKIELFPYSPPLLARGTSADVEWTRKTLKAIEAAGERHRVTLTAWLIPSPSAELPKNGEGLPTGSLTWTAEALPGEEVAFGQRERQDFISRYDVEVSSDAGVAAPKVGGVFSGNTVHLSASRVDGGARFHLRGYLDLAELIAIDKFQPDTPDLGAIDEPRVQAVGVAFSGVSESGGFLRVEIEGAPLSQPNWTLVVRCSTPLEPLGPSAESIPVGHEWRAIDTTLLSMQGRGFRHFDAGVGLIGQAGLAAMAPPAAPISPTGVLSAVLSDSRAQRSSSARSFSAQSSHQICDGLLLIAAESADDGLAEQVAAFVQTISRARLSTSEVELKHGRFRARFPVAEGEVARLTVGEERSLMTGYNAEIAPSTWMPSPIVGLTFDGLAWQGRREGDRLTSTSWISATSAVEIRDREHTQLGAVQLPKRSLRGAERSIRIDAGEIEVLSKLEASAGLSIRVSGS